MKKAVGYIRISKAETRSVSLDYQAIEVSRAAIAHGYEIISIQSDDGISGKAMANRPGIQTVMNMVITKEIDAVICYKSDRISRNGIESLSFESLLKSKNIEYISVTEGTIGSKDEDPLMPFLRGGLNQRERMIISMRTKSALQRKKELGVRLGAERFGMNDPTEKAALDRCIELNKLGLSQRKIADTLNMEGYKPRRGSKFWQKQVVDMLKAA